MTGAILDAKDAARRERLSSAPPAVEIDRVSKTFRLPRQRYSTLKERVLHPFASTTYDELRALRGIDVTIPRGEFFGIVGRNGSGKSTMLKCLAGIYRPDQGAVTIHGRLSPFIELGVGFNPDLTARDNVVINGVMMGLSRREARATFDQVIEFAGLEEFVDLKLKNYSSGMAVRLGFATAIQVDADVLLVDEVLAVGDAAFQQKCYEEFTRLKAEGKTIIFVTHDMGAVEQFCDRAILIERGEMLQLGEPHEVARAYNELNFGRLVHTATADGDGERYGDHRECEITDAWFEAGDERVQQIAQGERVSIVITARFHATVENPIFGVTLRNEVGHTIFTTTTEWAGVETGTFEAGQEATVRVGVDVLFAPSQYKLSPSVARAGSGADALDLREDLSTLYVHAVRTTGGIVDLPHTVEVERS